jgi:hypothetical protein
MRGMLCARAAVGGRRGGVVESALGAHSRSLPFSCSLFPT